MTTSESRRYTFAPFCLDERAGFLSRDGEELPLRPKSFAVLAELVRRHGELVSKEALLEAVWPSVIVEKAALKNCIREIRSILGDTPRASRYIQTVHRRGYRFIASIEENLASTQQELMVQREEPMAELTRQFEFARQGQRQVAFLSGEAGIGKSTLVNCFLEQVRGNFIARIGIGQCIEQYGAGEAFLPLLDLISQWLNQDDEMHLENILRHYAPSWIHRFPQLRLQPFEADDNPMLSIRELCDVLDVLSDEQPIVIALEDLQWSDRSTLDFIATLARRSTSANLMLIGSYRSEDVLLHQNVLPSLKQELLVHRLCREFPIKALDADGIGNYLSARFGTIAAQPEQILHLVQLIEQRTEGNPLFMVEVIEHLIGSEGLERQTSGWVLHPHFPELIEHIPEELEAFINQQLNRLETEAQSILEAGCLVGHEFSARVIEKSLEMDQDTIEDICTELADRGQFIRFNDPLEVEKDETVQRFGFLHRLHRETLRDRIPPARRIRLYRDLALRGEQLFADRPERVAAELASMFEGARNYEKAVHYLGLSGTRALHAGALAEARQQISRAFELLEEVEDIAARKALYSALGGTRDQAFGRST